MTRRDPEDPMTTIDLTDTNASEISSALVAGPAARPAARPSAWC